MIWHKVGDDSGRLKITHRFRREHEYIHVGYKNKLRVFFNKFETSRNYKNKYTNPDNDPRGEYKQGIISTTEEKSNPNSIYYGISGDSIPSLKVFINENKMATPVSILQDYGTAKSAGLKLTELFNGEKVFDYPKPPELIIHLLAIATDKEDIILDFHAG
jgi:adenine-specific DNA-methyltransferase